MAVEGDIGARHLIGRYSEAVVEVPLTGAAALTDVDTPEALKAVRAVLEGLEGRQRQAPLSGTQAPGQDLGAPLHRSARAAESFTHRR